MYDLTVPVRLGGSKSKQDRMHAANTSISELQEYYKQHRIYLNIQMKSKIGDLIKLMYDSFVDYDFSQWEGIERKEKSEYIKSAYAKISEKAFPISEEFEDLFRELLSA